MTKPDDIAYSSATDLLDQFKSNDLSPVEVATTLLDRIESHDGALNSFCLLDRETTLAVAGDSEKRWANGQARPLEGVPFAIKDLLVTKGWPTLRGSLTTDPNQNWDENAPTVARLLEAGAVPLGKTTTPEFGWKGVTDNPLTGITRNPWDVTKTPGGSSGGSSAAAAAGFAPLTLGTDGGGSIRIPASFAGIFGHKPSFGRVPAYPLSPFATVAHVGPMTRTVRDAAMMLTEIARPDSRDWYALPYEGVDYAAGLEKGVKGMRIAYSPALGFATVDPQVADAVAKAVDVLASLGAIVEEVDPGIEDPRDLFHVHWWSGVSKLFSGYNDAQLDRIDVSLRRMKERGDKFSRIDFQAAMAEREIFGAHMNGFMENYDLLATPAMPITAFDVDRLQPPGDDEDNWTQWTPFTYPFNLTQQPACSVPCGFDAAGLPIGLQLVGRKYEDMAVLRGAYAYEQATDWHTKRAEFTPVKR